MKSGWKLLVGVAISALLIWWVLRDVAFLDVWEEVRDARWGLLLAAIAITTFGFFIRALRWKIFLHPVRPHTSLRSRFAAVNIGFGLNNVLPWRMGEIARIWSFSRIESVPLAGTAGSLVVERMMDAIAIFGLLLVAVLHPSFPDDPTVAGRPLGALLPVVSAAIGGGVVFLFLLVAFPGPLVGGLRRIAPRLPGAAGHLVVDLLEAFVRGLGALRTPKLLALGLLWSFGFWLFNAFSFLLAMRAFGIEEGYVAALFLQAVIGLAVAVPAAPGFIGTFHAGAVVALQEVYGAGEGATLAFAFAYHLGGFIPVTALGLWYAGRVGLSLSEIERAGEEVEAELEGETPKGGTSGGERPEVVP